MEKFSPGVADRLGCYVYRLIDPRNGMTFYVGRGRGDRVFSHANGTAAATELEDDESLKKKIIHAIRNDHFEVQHVIHRHGMDEKTAREVEAALIEAYLGLSNVQSGYAPERSVQHADQIERLYTAKEAVFLENVLMININQRIEEVPIIDAVRYAWKVSKPRAEKVRYVLAVKRGIIVGAFVAEKWLQAIPENFPGFPGDRFNALRFYCARSTSRSAGSIPPPAHPASEKGGSESDPLRNPGTPYPVSHFRG